jgi:hypothetical protein
LAKVNSGGKLALIDSEGREVWSWAYMELVAQKFIGQINATTPNEALNAWAAARNSHAISSLRTINSAEAEFFKRGRYGSIPELVGASLLTPNFTEVIDSYRFEVNLLAGNSSYQAITRPATAMPGLWDYYSGPDGIVHYSTTVGRAPAGAEGQQP